MNDYSDIITAEVVKPNKAGKVILAEHNFNVKMDVALHGLGRDDLVFRFTGDNPMLHAYLKSHHEYGPHEVSLVHICDYLIFVRRGNVLHPILVELGKTSPGNHPRKKIEQLYCSQVLVDFYQAVYAALLNGRYETAAPRFVLIYQSGKVKINPSYTGVVRLSRKLPRVIMQERNMSHGFKVYYYGGKNKIIKVAAKIMDDDSKFYVEDIFSALPEAEPDRKTTLVLKRGYERLIMKHGLYK